MAKKKVISKEDLRSEAIAVLASGVQHSKMTPGLIVIVEEWLAANPVPLDLPELTERQAEIFSFIKEKIKKQETPTIREIGTRFGIKSPNGVMCHLKALERKGLISRRDSSSRNGKVNAGY